METRDENIDARVDSRGKNEWNLIPFFERKYNGHLLHLQQDWKLLQSVSLKSSWDVCIHVIRINWLKIS